VIAVTCAPALVADDVVLIDPAGKPVVLRDPDDEPVWFAPDSGGPTYDYAVPWVSKQAAEKGLQQRRQEVFQGLYADEQEVLDNVLGFMGREVTRLRDKARFFPGQEYDGLAAELDGYVKTLRKMRVQGGLPFKDGTAYTLDFAPNTIFITPQFKAVPGRMNVTTVTLQKHGRQYGQGSELRQMVETAKELRYGELAAILVHELLHDRKQSALTFKSEREARSYTLEYKMLRVLNDDRVRRFDEMAKRNGLQPYDRSELDNCVDYLAELGVSQDSKNPQDRLDRARWVLDSVLNVPNEQPTPPDMWKPLETRLPAQPVVPEGALTAQQKRRQREAVVKWRDTWDRELARARETDPARLANKQAYLAAHKSFVRGPRKMPCRHCGFNGKHYWFSDRWSCPQCEHCTLPSQVLCRTHSHKTFRTFANERKRIYDDKRRAIRQQAEAAIKAIEARPTR
jgi:hypothetical protein